MAIFLQVDGITGSATEASHTNWIPIQSMTFGVTRNITMNVGNLSDREASLPSITEVHITKEMDQSSIELFGWAVAKSTAKTVTIDLITTGSENPFTQYVLTDAVISGYSPSASSGKPMESISFSFAQIQVKYTPVGEGMIASSPVIKGFNVATAQVM